MKLKLRSWSNSSTAVKRTSLNQEYTRNKTDLVPIEIAVKHNVRVNQNSDFVYWLHTTSKELKIAKLSMSQESGCLFSSAKRVHLSAHSHNLMWNKRVPLITQLIMWQLYRKSGNVSGCLNFVSSILPPSEIKSVSVKAGWRERWQRRSFNYRWGFFLLKHKK